ncbi:MAG TPA: hypothetical protein PK878_18905 [bacterium]|nr:hypothetical protein [Candidatus Omnitrophota bacterium]HOJ62355.1 hypothetical protein [bacterium]HOL93829.1 hypothetical protein [bacterium]HPO99769.1 hypothetical protein [bacterium]HXK95780.1 hypothetical protein [bacterium]
MMDYEWILFWFVILALFLFSLTTGSEWLSVLRKAYNHTVNVLKWQPFLEYITGGISKGKRHVSLDTGGEEGPAQIKRSRIFPRSRRST